MVSHQQDSPLCRSFVLFLLVHHVELVLLLLVGVDVVVAMLMLSLLLVSLVLGLLYLSL